MARLIDTRRTNATTAFLARKAEIDALLTRIRDLSEDHFEVDPDEIHWGHVGDLARVVDQLKSITDALFSEGEYAPENQIRR